MVSLPQMLTEWHQLCTLSWQRPNETVWLHKALQRMYFWELDTRGNRERGARKLAWLTKTIRMPYKGSCRCSRVWNSRIRPEETGNANVAAHCPFSIWHDHILSHIDNGQSLDNQLRVCSLWDADVFKCFKYYMLCLSWWRILSIWLDQKILREAFSGRWFGSDEHYYIE